MVLSATNLLILVYFIRFVVLFVPLPARLQTCAHDYSFCLLIYGSVFDYSSAYISYQGLSEVNQPPSDNGDLWYYNTFESGSTHNLQIGVVETRKRNAIGNLITGGTLPSHDVSWVASAEHHITFDEAAVLMQLEEDGYVDDLWPLPNDMEDPLAVENDVEDGWDLHDIPSSDALEVQCCLLGDFLAI